LDGPLRKWCPAVALSLQDGRHSAVALLLKAALIQVSDYRLLGASGLLINLLYIWKCLCEENLHNLGGFRVRDMVFKTTLSNISVISLRSVL
jgi:hypothetical protein